MQKDSTIFTNHSTEVKKEAIKLLYNFIAHASYFTLNSRQHAEPLKTLAEIILPQETSLFHKHRSCVLSFVYNIIKAKARKKV